MNPQGEKLPIDRFVAGLVEMSDLPENAAEVASRVESAGVRTPCDREFRQIGNLCVNRFVIGEQAAIFPGEGLKYLPPFLTVSPLEFLASQEHGGKPPREITGRAAGLSPRSQEQVSANESLQVLLECSQNTLLSDLQISLHTGDGKQLS